MSYTKIFKDYRLNQEIGIEIDALYSEKHYEITHFLEWTSQGRVICWNGKVFDSNGKSHDNRSCIVPMTENIRKYVRKIELIKSLRECIPQWVNEMNLIELEEINNVLEKVIKRVSK